jgi:hypothetical protein
VGEYQGLATGDLADWLRRSMYYKPQAWIELYTVWNP